MTAQISRPRLASAVVALTLLLAGCGSTAQRGSTASGEPRLELQAGGGDLSGNAAGTPLTTAAWTAAGVAQATTPGATGVGGTVAGNAGAVKGRGFDATHLYVGISTADQSDQSAAAVGLVGVTTGNTRRQVDAIIADANKHGGALGRQIVPVYFDTSQSSSGTRDGEAQAGCSAWTEDKHVFAVVSQIAEMQTPVLYGCLAKKDTPLITSALNAEDNRTYDRYGRYLYLPGVMGYTHLAPIWVNRLVAQGYFAGNPKVGLFARDDKSGHDIAADVQAALKPYGLALTDSFYYPADAAQIPSQASSAVLRFNSKGIDRVMLVDASGFFFMLAAQSQAYSPRYALSTYNAPAGLLQQNVPATQLANSIGVGFAPAYDVDANHDVVLPEAARCRALLANVGEHPDRIGESVAFGYCDGIHVLAQALNRAGTMTTTALETGIYQLSRRFKSSITFQSTFARGWHDGAAAVRDLFYDSSCSCFRYRDAIDHRV